MNDPVFEERLRGHTVRIVHDEHADNPRDWDNLGTMTCWHRRTILGDSHDHETPQDFLASLCGLENSGNLSMERLLPRARHKTVILPLYLFDHGGLAMNTTGFGCPWDSGQVGFIYVGLPTIREEYGCKRVSPALRRRAVRQLRQEVATYDDFIEGNCFGYIVEDGSGELIASCWGFIGDYENYCLDEARQAVPGAESPVAD